MADDKQNKRGTNWSEGEKIALIQSLQKKENVLFGKLKGPGESSSITTDTKRTDWEKVYEKVNAVSSVHRPLDEIKKQYDNIKQRAKENLDNAKRPKTGGGPREETASFTDLFLHTHDSRPNVTGLNINIDTCDGTKRKAPRRMEDIMMVEEIKRKRLEQQKLVHEANYYKVRTEMIMLQTYVFKSQITVVTLPPVNES